MNPEMTAFKTLFDYKLEPEVYSFHLLDALIKLPRNRASPTSPSISSSTPGCTVWDSCPRRFLLLSVG